MSDSEFAVRVRVDPRECNRTPEQLAEDLRHAADTVSVRVIPSIGAGAVYLHARVAGVTADDALAQVQEVLDQHRGCSISGLL